MSFLFSKWQRDLGLGFNGEPRVIVLESPGGAAAAFFLTEYKGSEMVEKSRESRGSSLCVTGSTVRSVPAAV